MVTAVHRRASGAHQLQVWHAPRTGEGEAVITLDVEIPTDLLRRLDPARAEKALGAATLAIGTLVQGELQKSTPRAHSPVIWQSAKSRRYYFWLRRRYGLPLQYTRNSDPMSQRLQRSWTVKRQGRTSAVVGIRARPYAKYVQSEARQTRQHRATGWVTEVQAVSNVSRSGDVERVVQQAVAKEWTG